MYAMAITSMLAPYAINENRRLYNLYARLTGKFSTRTEEEEAETDSGDRIVILGYHRGAEALVNRLSTTSPNLVQLLTVIDFNPESLRSLKAAGIRTVFGDISSPDTLAKAGVPGAAVILSTIPDVLLRGTTNLDLVRNCRSLAPHARIIATADTQRQAESLREAGAALVILPYQLTADYLAGVLSTESTLY
jgi:Trk K+ transport system NAD-binding subunit